MKLSVLERMVREGDLSSDAARYLLNCRGECEWLDFKQHLSFDNDKAICDFARDVLAMKNVGGGYIVVGVEDRSWNPVGLSSPLPVDSKQLRDKVRHATGIELEVDIVHHEFHEKGRDRRYAIVLVRASKRRKKRRSPTVAAKDFCHNQAYGLRRGDIFVRRGDSTTKIQTQAELEDLLDALESQADQDALEPDVSPFAVEDGTYRLLEKGFDHFVGRDNLREQVVAAITKDPRIWIINVHGPGGVGKSALVNWAVYELYNQRHFEAILHLTAKETVLTPSGIVKCSRSLYSLENLLDHILGTFAEDSPGELDKKKKLAIDYLTCYRMLLVLDNMETVTDSRILTFVQTLPPACLAKVLLTSRQKTGGWELPISVQEMNAEEVREFVRMKASEMGLNFPQDRTTISQIWEASGGLPLAVQWILGKWRKTKTVDKIVREVSQKDSPVLEFSFGNIWRVLSPDGKAILAVLSIFEEPPTVEDLIVATELPQEKIDKALQELADVTLVNRNTQASDGRARFVALPITLSFARHQLQTMGDFELKCRRRFQKFSEQMELQEAELFKFKSRFERFDLRTDNEKRAAILCQRGQSEIFVGNTENADLLFKQARELAPQSAYIYAMSASYELARNRIGNALLFADEACRRANRKTGSLCYAIKARVFDVQHDHQGRVEALERALEYDPDDMITRHQYGVALSRVGRPRDAVDQFTIIVDANRDRTPSRQLLMALKTRILNLQRLDNEIAAQHDLALVSDLLKRNPHLSNQVSDFENLRT